MFGLCEVQTRSNLAASIWMSASGRHAPRLALSRREAAAALGMSLRHFQRHVQPHLRCIYSGQLRLYPVTELERWVNEESWRSDAGT
jgi:hypothetical protein